MTDSETTSEAQSVDHSQVDHLLQMFVGFVNKGLPAGNVSLFVGGTAICGDLISSETYFREVAKQFESPSNGEIGKIFSDQMKFLADEVKPVPASDSDDQPQESPCYIHMRVSSLWSAAGRTEVQNALWRGRLDAVDGFNFGAPSA